MNFTPAGATGGPTRENEQRLQALLCRSRYEMSGVKRLFQLGFTAAAGHMEMPPAYLDSN
jgi:hypothetical protein